MIRNYFTVAVRNLKNNKGLTFINIMGLAIGMACVILIGLYIQYELSYDRHHKNADRIYHVVREVDMANNPQVSPSTSGALATGLKQDFPEVEIAIRLRWIESWIQTEDRFFQQALVVTDKDFLKMFTVDFTVGDPETVFDKPGSIVLSESMAKKFFDDQDPVGKRLLVNHQELSGEYFVTGVFRDFPSNSTLSFDFLTTTPYGTLERVWFQWEPTGPVRLFFTYVMLPEGYDPKKLEQKFPSFVAQHMGKDTTQNMRYRLEPFAQSHLYTNFYTEFFEKRGDIKQVYTLGLVASFILILACINFTNLSTARSSLRAREVGLRKVVGAFRQQLIAQFLAESVMMALFALMVAVALVELVLPWFNDIVSRPLMLHRSDYFGWLAALVGLGIGVGILAGSYPALVLSHFEPAQVMKGDWRPGSKRVYLRQILVVFQFVFSIVFITGTIVVQNQLDFIRHKDLGFDKERIVQMPIFIYARQLHRPLTSPEKYAEVKAALLRHTNVSKTTGTRFPQGGYITTDDFRAEGHDVDFQMGVFDIDQDYLDFFGIELAAGRMPDSEWRLPPSAIAQKEQRIFLNREMVRQYIEKGRGYILNETAVRQLGWTPEEALGKRFGIKTRSSHLNDYVMGYGHIGGVVKDFHVQSLHNTIRPVVFSVRTVGAKHLYVKLGPGKLPETMAFLEETWKRFLPEVPFEYAFLDENLTRTRYENEIRTGKALTVFSGLTIFVACLGLFGLIAFRVDQKTKEIGIRKVMGASVGNIFGLLAREFILMVGIASIIACPVAYVLARGWLQDFAYRIDLDVWVFLLGGLMALIIALATISFQALKAARSNPVDSLRTE